MDKVATLTDRERADLFQESAARTGFPAELLEKDFWVCWTLRQIFSDPGLAPHLRFKGGTSLSKVFDAIQRFSEDIDLAVDWERLGHSGNPPGSELSKNKLDKLQKQMVADCRAFIAGPLLKALQVRFEAVLGPDRGTLRPGPEQSDVLVFEYPQSLQNRGGYLKRSVILELGTHAAFKPAAQHTIEPIIAGQFPHIFVDSQCPVHVIGAERTFWEKATILHGEAHRGPEQQDQPQGYSRHYYDLVLLARRTEIKKKALDDLELLRAVVDHKVHFYPRRWARYEEAVPATIRLLPNERWEAALRHDYRQMQVMMYPDSEPPSFDEIVAELAMLEAEIRRLQPS